MKGAIAIAVNGIPIFQLFCVILRFLRDLFYPKQTICAVDSKNYETNIGRLKKDIIGFHNNASPDVRSYLPFLWLKRKVEG